MMKLILFSSTFGLAKLKASIMMVTSILQLEKKEVNQIGQTLILKEKNEKSSIKEMLFTALIPLCLACVIDKINFHIRLTGVVYKKYFFVCLTGVFYK